MNFIVRKLTVDDLPAADQLRALAGWNQTIPDWERLLDLEPEGCFTADQGGRIVGTATTTSYGNRLAWIGMMLVHPDCRRQGIGHALFEGCLAYLRQRGLQCIKLDATPLGQPLYEQFGFHAEWTFARWEHPESRLFPAGAFTGIRPARPADWASILALDAQVFGVPREKLLPSLAEDSQRVLVCFADNSLQGFGMLRNGVRANYLGPIIARQNLGTQLVKALLAGHQGKPIFWDIPDQNETTQGLARQLGFVPVRPLTRMFFGDNTVPSDVTAQYGFADPATG
jgi:GNAT superfamily N-acetyltransferase